MFVVVSQTPSRSCQAKTDSEEKQSLIDHFQEKLKLLEQRSHAEKLPQDEQIQAFIAEVCNQMLCFCFL